MLHTENDSALRSSDADGHISRQQLLATRMPTSLTLVAKIPETDARRCGPGALPRHTTVDGKNGKSVLGGRSNRRRRRRSLHPGAGLSFHGDGKRSIAKASA